MHASHSEGPIDDGESDALGRTGADIAGREDDWNRGLQRAKLAAGERPPAGAQCICSRQDVAQLLARDCLRQPRAARLGATNCPSSIVRRLASGCRASSSALSSRGKAIASEEMIGPSIVLLSSRIVLKPDWTCRESWGTKETPQGMPLAAHLRIERSMCWNCSEFVGGTPVMRGGKMWTTASQRSCCLSAHYDARLFFRIRFVLEDQFADHPRDVSLAEKHEAGARRKRRFIGPPEMNFRRFA